MDGRLDVHTTARRGNYVAVATSEAVDDSGRPLLVEVLEFQATNPLSKAIQIPAFREFDFRSSQLHDEVTTLEELLRLWNPQLTPEEERWWPEHPSFLMPQRAAELIYATLGPWATSELIHALESSTNRESETIQRLVWGLTECVGQRPRMLIALATSIGATQRHWNCGRSDSGPVENAGVGRFTPETVKHFGSLVLEAAQQFGFDEATFGSWFEAQGGLFFDSSEWPPVGVSYSSAAPVFGNPASGEPSPMFSAERQAILTNLELDAGITRGVHGPTGPTVPLSQDSARSWARLVSATVQAWHNNLGDPANRLGSPYDDDMFTYNMLESIIAIPKRSWSRLTDARRVCFVADLGELLRVISELGGGDITARSEGALGLACDGDADLISIAERAGLDLPYRNGLAEFTNGIMAIRNRGGN